MWDWGAAWDISPTLLRGLLVTIQATLAGITLAMILGLILAMIRRSAPFFIRWPVAGFIEFVRSTPLLVQLYFVFFVGPSYGLELSPFQTGALVLGIHYATYTSEVYRAGIESVPRGQWEASTAISLNPLNTWTRIVLPQAIPVVVPALGNYLIAMFKDAPLLSSIAVVELLAEGRAFCSRDFICLESFTLVGAYFLAVSIPCSILVRQLERRLVPRQA